MKSNFKYLSMFIFLLLITSVIGCDSSDKNISKINSADGSSIAYSESGQGDIALVFVHCWTCNLDFWEGQVEYFSKKYKVVRLDLAGHGLSSSQRENYTMEAFGQDVVSVVNQIKSKKFILVGHSMGGPVIVEAAKTLGDKVIGLIGVDTFYTPFQYPKSQAKIEGFVKPFRQNFKESSTNLVRSMFTPQADPQIIESIVKNMTNSDPKMGVSAIHEIFNWKADDKKSDLKSFSKILRNINAAPTGKEKALHESVTLIKEVGHFIPQVKPNEFNQELEKIILSLQ